MSDEKFALRNQNRTGQQHPLHIIKIKSFRPKMQEEPCVAALERSQYCITLLLLAADVQQAELSCGQHHRTQTDFDQLGH